MNVTRGRNPLARAGAVLFLAALLLLGGAATASPPPSGSAAGVTRAAPSTGPAPASPAPEVAAYAERDRKASKELREFSGGDRVVITASALAIVLLVVLLVLLLR